MPILKIIPYLCKDTITVLKVLLTKATAGKLRGLALCYRTADGHERVLLTGIYRQRPEFALSAAHRLQDSAIDFEDSCVQV